MKTCGVLAALVASLLCGCTKTVEYEEEVAMGDPPRIQTVQRREVLELVLHQFSPRWSFKRSELFLFGRREPDWSDQLWPLYLEESDDGKSYLLVAAINSSIACVSRGRPASKYVAVNITPSGASEIPIPARLNGKPSNLLLRFERIPNGVKRISIAEKDRLNNLYGGPSDDDKRLLLSKTFGC
jgi:hypothetical protein